MRESSYFSLGNSFLEKSDKGVLVGRSLDDQEQDKFVFLQNISQ